MNLRQQLVASLEVTPSPSDALTRALAALTAAECALTRGASDRPYRSFDAQRLTFIASQARGIAERAEQAAINCNARRQNMADAEASINSITGSAA